MIQKIKTVLLALLILFLSTTAFSGNRQPIIDMHMHASSIKFWGFPDGESVPIISFPNGFSKDHFSPSSDDAVMKETLIEMDKYNVIFGFLSGLPEDVAHWVAYAPGRFIPSPQIPLQHLNGNYTMPSMEYLRAEHTAGRIKALGEFTSQYYGFAPNDPILEPYFDLAVELDIPVLIHTLGIGAPLPAFRCYRGRPLLLEDVLARRPKLRLWVENAGWPFLSDIIALMYQYPQVYADLSTISWVIPRKTFHNYLKNLMQADLGKRLMFGTDQMIWPGTIRMAIDSIESASFLTPEQKRDIYYNNAARFLRINKVPSKK
ncbi:MAG: amidohydrolase family protein [Desulfobacteraceae bacterium]|nr:amidohydrolase family protein [Desulfobacteraceae bacterium]